MDWRRHRRLIVFASFWVFLLVALAIFVFATQDIEPPNDVDLLVIPDAVPDELNGASLRVNGTLEGDIDDEAAGLLAAFGLEAAGESPETILERAGALWDTEKAQSVLERLSPALEFFRAAGAKPQFQVPVFERISDFESADYLREWLVVGVAAELDAVHRYKTGDAAGAVAIALDVIRFGRRIEGGGGSMVALIFGATIKHSGLRLLRRLAAVGALDAEACRQAIRDLDGAEVEAQSVVQALRHEYRMASQFLSDVEVDDAAAEKIGGSWSLLFLKPNRTRTQLAETFRAAIEHVESGSTEYRSWASFVKPIRSLGNMVGDGFYEDASRVIRLVESRLDGYFAVRATRAVLALRAFYLAENRLPERLEVLVPDYLPAVPLDPFDGRPLRYSPRKRILYSVGSDLVDVSGSSAANEGAAKDPTEPTIRVPNWGEDGP